ncbi:hypothetical protein M2396_000732 [Pseudomonas sp. BIGb0278]|uniref:phage tail assembly chaperone n=1 Tax=Pseudomonas sp. BIGb0278 TaxID=2940607 RepID=UPI002167956E|nr:phage tail assembly chaperone [Pseudomonas sp. BIGb0278]MCS4282467.1 hypothetical protein [Pseudomonas sp. BIGb0278]
MFYSPGTLGFYHPNVHGKNIPADAVEISDEDYNGLLSQLTAGKRIVPGDDGFPCAVDQVLPTEEQTTGRERAWRDAQLLEFGGLRDRHRDEQDLGRETTLNGEQFGELLGYLQALRDWPQSENFPVLEHRPIAPPWIVDQTL